VRSYDEFCALARALDVVGDRWTLLIIRELFARDGRYSDLRDALPGIATNLLAERLRQLQEAGVVEAYEAPPPVRASVYRLTPRGRELGPAMRALVIWGLPLLASGQGADAFRTQWLVMAVRILFDGVDVADLAPLTVVVESGDKPATIEVSPEGLWMELGAPGSEAQVEVAGESEKVFEFLIGMSDAQPDGVSIRGPREATRRLRAIAARSPLAERASPSRGQHPASAG
jgi:DNA-binding HxlR family transcriptional regulator